MRAILVNVVRFCFIFQCYNAYEVEKLPGPYLVLGEGPHWDVDTQSLYYLDILNAGSIYRYDFNEDVVYDAKIQNETLVSFITPVQDSPGEFVVGIGRRVGIINWDGKSKIATVDRILFEVEQEERYKFNRFNDGKADQEGRILGGTMHQREECETSEYRDGNFYTYDKHEGVTRHWENISISNGLAWNEANDKLYYIDSCDFNVKEFDYYLETGFIGEPRIVIDLHAKKDRPKLVPDGMTIDSEGFLYVATYGGSRILKVNPENGNIELEIQFPTEQITSSSFGGPNLDILFVTTSSVGNKPEPAGATFKVTNLEAIGKQMYKAKI